MCRSSCQQFFFPLQITHEAVGKSNVSPCCVLSLKVNLRSGDIFFFFEYGNVSTQRLRTEAGCRNAKSYVFQEEYEQGLANLMACRNSKCLKFLSVVENPHLQTYSWCLLVIVVSYPLNIFYIFISIYLYFFFLLFNWSWIYWQAFVKFAFLPYLSTEDRCIFFLLVVLTFVAMSVHSWCTIRTSLYWVSCTGSGIILDRPF